MAEYCHTLIPDRVDFVPDPSQVADFLVALDELEAAPKKPTITVAKPFGESRVVVNPFTGKAMTFANWKGRTVKTNSAVAPALKGLIVKVARKSFGVGFVQGCHWCG